MIDPHLEDHAVGVELQLTELVEEQERARVQGRPQQVATLQREIEALQAELAATADRIAAPSYEEAEVVDGSSTLEGGKRAGRRGRLR